MSEHIRPVKPPVRAWINVPRLLAPAPGHVYRDRPNGLELTFAILGSVGGWAERGDGGLLALVTYPLASRDGEYSTEVTHFVPRHLVEKHSYVRNRRHTKGGLDH